MNKIEQQIMKLFLGLLLFLLFTACDDRSNSENISHTPVTLNETQVLTMDKSTPIGTIIGKIQLPKNRDNNKIKNIFLTGEGSQQFSISKDGTIKKIFEKSKQIFYKSNRQIIIYNLKVEIFYFSKEVYYINLQIKEFSSKDEENITIPTPIVSPRPTLIITPTPTVTPRPTPALYLMSLTWA